MSDRISNDIPPQMKILNTVIPLNMTSQRKQNPELKEKPLDKVKGHMSFGLFTTYKLSIHCNSTMYD